MTGYKGEPSRRARSNANSIYKDESVVVIDVGDDDSLTVPPID
jgi:hypothetical protein